MSNKRTDIVAWALTYHRVVVLCTVCLIVFGIIALDKMNKNEFPDCVIRQGLVVAVYPGASVSEVDEQVTRPLEDYVFSFKEVKKSKTKAVSRHGISIIQVELNPELKDNDVFWSKFKHGIAAVQQALPAGVLAVLVEDDFGDTSAVLLTLESDERTAKDLSDIMDALQDRLRTVEAVGRMKVLGKQQEQVNIYLDNSRLAHYGLSYETVALALYTKGLTTMAGTLRNDGINSPLRVAPAMNVEQDIASTIVYASPTGAVVRLKDIATVRREYAPFTQFITNNGVSSLLLSIEMKKGRNITAMGKEIDKILETFAATLPPDVHINKITDQPHVVAASVREFLGELVIAIVAVMIVVMLLLPLRVAAVASATIPITIFIALGLFYAFGIELNTVTLAALLVTLGMIVDNSIVIIDAYMEKITLGEERRSAAIAAARHFFPSILTATLAISITFFPLLLTIEGTFRDFLLAFPYAITIVLAVSLAVAELLVPFLLYFFVREPQAAAETATRNKRGAFDRWLQRHYNRLVAACFDHPYATLAGGAGTVLLAILLLHFLPLRLMPTADRNQFAVEIYLPTGSTLRATQSVADSVEALLREDERVLSITKFLGLSSPRFQTGYAPQFADENYAQFIVNTPSPSATVQLLDKYSALGDRFPEAYVRFKQLAYGVEENPIEVRLAGSDAVLLQQCADTLLSVLRQDKRLCLVRSDSNEPLLTTLVSPDAVAMERYGVNNASLALTLAARYTASGLPLATLWDGSYSYPVVLKSTVADSASIAMLGEELIPVFGGLRAVPLRALATLSAAYEEGQITRRNGLRTITIKSEVQRGLNTTAVTKEVHKLLRTVALPEDVDLSFGGEEESNNDNLPKIIAALAISVVIIFFLLVAHYKGVRIPLLLLVSLSLTLFGTVVSIFLARVDFGVTSFLGIISLMGILVRNTIIMYDYAGELRRDEHCDIKTASLLSAQRRMHPIFLTSVAAAMGVVPMILGGSGLWQPMGVIICYGTLITMLLILTVLPIAYWKIHNAASYDKE